MDPKMDSGYLAGGEKLDDDYDVLRKLLPEETLGIMDQLLCHEVGFQLLIATSGGISDADLGYIDGLAHGKPSLTNTVHLSLH